MQTKKHLGQHWLHDEMVLDAMCQSADVGSNDLVIEIGPGLGTLTEKLLQTGAEVWALEYDESLIPGLRNKFASYDKTKFSIEHADILKYDFNRPPNDTK